MEYVQMANEKFNVVGTNIAEKATVIWNVADMLRGPFKPHEYGLVILPMTVVKRFHDCLLPTHEAVLAQYEKVKNFAVVDGFLTKASGYQFYNTSKYTFDSLLADPENIEANFRDYLNGFSANVQDVLSKFDFDNIIKRMVDSNTLYLVIKEFNSQKGYLGPDKISAVDCGYIFEDLVKRFSESFGEEAGAHFTSRDVIYLMTDLLLSDADLSKGGNVTVYDMAMGTSQMLSCMEERIHELNSEIDVTCFGQEFNPSTFAIAKADMMIRGGDPNNMRFGDTLSEDQFSGYQFQYIISNPPFGIDWKREQKVVEAEAAKGELGRFAPGLPKISDGQQLFVLNGLSKLATNGKMAIIQNGSPLFSGDAGSGPSEIRRYILENDWLDAIVQLSTDMFMNTGISTYIWILNKNKPAYRAGKVQLIDASHCYEARRKSIGTKRNDITDLCRELITKAYGEFKHDEIYGDKSGVYCHSKIYDSEEFGYNKIVVEQPQRDENGEIILKKGKPIADASLRDTENVPLTEDIEEYFKREVLPYAPDAWIDTKKTKVGYRLASLHNEENKPVFSSVRGGIDFKCLCTSENIRRKRLYSKEDGCFQSNSNLVRKVITLSNKVYVDVLAEFSKDGLLIPKEITWEDGRKYEITRVKDKRRAASTRAGGVGERYTCVVDGKEIFLFYEDNNMWFMERAGA